MIGRKVYATWRGSTVYYDGRIVEVDRDFGIDGATTFAIQFNDGDYDDGTTAGSILASAADE